MIPRPKHRHLELSPAVRRRLERTHPDLIQEIARRARLAPETVLRVWRGWQTSDAASLAMDEYLTELGELRQLDEGQVQVHLSCWVSRDDWKSFEQKVARQKLSPEQVARKAFDLFVSDGDRNARPVRRARSSPTAERVSAAIEAGPLVIDLGSRSVRRDGEDIRFTRTQFEILALLAENLGRVVATETIIRRLWGPRAADAQSLRVHVGQIRKKIEPDTSKPRFLLTAAGVGYQLANPSE